MEKKNGNTWKNISAHRITLLSGMHIEKHFKKAEKHFRHIEKHSSMCQSVLLINPHPVGPAVFATQGGHFNEYGWSSLS